MKLKGIKYRMVKRS